MSARSPATSRPPGPSYHATAAGPLHDEASFWAAYFAHQHHGWSADPPARTVAVGRASGSLEALNRWPEAAAFVVLAAALVCLGRAR